MPDALALKRFFKERIADCLFSGRNLRNSKLLAEQNCRILMYHAIETQEHSIDRMGLAVSPKVFCSHMAYLQENGFQVIALADLVRALSRDCRLEKKSVVITFDDGYRSILTNALPVLQKFGFPASIFVNVDFLQGRLQHGLPWDNWPALDWEQLRQLHQLGLNVGAHGITHRRLTQLNSEELVREITGSRQLIAGRIGAEVNTFSYPRGAFNQAAVEVLKNNGFHCACSSIEGLNTIDTDSFALRRTEITAFDDQPGKFGKKMLGCYDWLARFRKP